PNPRADRPFIEAIHAHVDARRPLATELYVIGCEYVPLAVSVGVDLREGAPQEEALLAVREAVRRVLWARLPRGPEGNRGALGRPVRDREIEVVAAQIPGVLEVHGVNLFRRAGKRWSRVTTVGSTGAVSLGIDPWALPELLAVLVVTGDAPQDPDRLPNSF